MSTKKCETLAEFLAVDAEYYDHNDAERLHHTEVEEFVDSALEGGALGAEEVLEVVAWRRRTVTTSHLRIFAASLLEDLLERFDEEYGDPEGEATEPTEGQKGAMAGAVSCILGKSEPWQCEPVAHWSATRADVAGLLS